MAEEKGPMPQENEYATLECLIRSAVSRSHDSVDYVMVALASFRGAEKYSFEQALKCAETLYLESYTAWTAEKNDKATYRELHEKAKAIRDKLLEVKKLLDELECEGDRLLQFVHALRT
jgi:hypothetical protein